MNSTAVPLPLDVAEDDEVELTDWLVADGTHVEAGQPVAEVSTAKTSIEVLAPVGGVLRYAAQVGDLITPSGSIGSVEHD